jgi:hypothetical protein
MTDEEGMELGRITIRYFIPADGDGTTVGITLPDFEEVPMVVQLGMIELAKDHLLKAGVEG